MSESFRDTYGPWAVVTGAASGIGAAFAEALGARGAHVLAVDLDAGALEARAAGVRACGVEVRTLVGDLTDPAFVERLSRLASELEVGLLVHCAGVAHVGSFLGLSIEDHVCAVDLHCRASVALARAFAEPMRRRGRGGIVLLSSNSAYLHTPLIANYAATKAYTLALAEALWEELRHHGVHVLGLAPGMTKTPLLLGSRPDSGRVARLMLEPEALVARALARLGKGPSYVPTLSDRMAAVLFARLLPRRWSLPLARRSVEWFFPHLKGE